MAAVGWQRLRWGNGRWTLLSFQNSTADPKAILLFPVYFKTTELYFFNNHEKCSFLTSNSLPWKPIQKAVFWTNISKWHDRRSEVILQLRLRLQLEYSVQFYSMLPKMWTYWRVPEKVMKTVRRLECLSCEDRLRQLELFSLEKASWRPHWGLPVLRVLINKRESSFFSD